MIYNLKNKIEESKFSERAEKLKSKGSVVELTKKKPQRTLPQNNYLHLLLTYFSVHFGLTLQEAKTEHFKIVCNPELFIVRNEHKILGQYITIRSSADLTTEELSTAIDRFKNYSSGQGLILPNSEDFHFLNHIRNLEKENKEWL